MNFHVTWLNIFYLMCTYSVNYTREHVSAIILNPSVTGLSSLRTERVDGVPVRDGTSGEISGWITCRAAANNKQLAEAEWKSQNNSCIEIELNWFNNSKLCAFKKSRRMVILINARATIQYYYFRSDHLIFKLLKHIKRNTILYVLFRLVYIKL